MSVRPTHQNKQELNGLNITWCNPSTLLHPSQQSPTVDTHKITMNVTGNDVKNRVIAMWVAEFANSTLSTMKTLTLWVLYAESLPHIIHHGLS